MSDYVLYGSKASLFTGKARAYMNWKGIAFEEQAVNAQIISDIIMPNVGWMVVPVVQMPDGRIVQDTADIIEAIEANAPEPCVMPDAPVLHFASLLMQVFGDQWLSIPAMHYRWNYNEDWVYSEFGRSMLPNATPAEQYETGKNIGQRFRKMVPALGITPDTIPGIEASYEAFLKEFSDHLAQHDFVFGARPSYADFSLYAPLYAHLYRDPESRIVMERVAPPVARWVERVKEGRNLGPLIDGNEVPPSLHSIFSRHSKEHLPVLLATQRLLETWAKSAQVGDVIPRSLGQVPFEMEGVSGQIIARPFSLFRLQMALDVLRGLSPEDREIANQFLRDTGAAELINFKSGYRLERRNCKLCLASG